VLDFGCGTGWLVTIPLLALGYRVTGVDIDERSIHYGRALCERAGLDARALRCGDLGSLEGRFDAAIAAEVFEHLSDEEVAQSLDALHARLRPGGQLLVTVPNGYGLFELESHIYDVLRRRGPFRRLAELRAARRSEAAHHPMSLGQTPHQQRFTWGRIERVLARGGFKVEEFEGATLTCGPFSARLFPRVPPLMNANAWLGRRLPRVAADYYVRARRRD